MATGSGGRNKRPGAFTNADIKRARIALARKSLPAFVEYVLRDGGGKQVKCAPHQIAWWEHLKYSWAIGKTPLILAPMSFGKSNVVAIALPLFLLGQNENFRIILISSAEKTASQRLETIGRYIEESPQYKEVFPWIEPDYSKDWNKQHLNVKRKADDGGMVGAINDSISAYGYTSRAGIGARCDVEIFDDVVDESNSVISPSARESLKGLVTTQWLTRPDPVALYDRWGELFSPGPLIAGIGTRYHEEDLYADWINNPDAYCTMVQGVSDDFSHLDVTVYGANVNVPHPTHAKYAEWAYVT